MNLRDRWTRPTIDHCPGSFGFLALMLIVAVLTGADVSDHKDFMVRMVFSIDGTLSNIRSGEVWRLLSPIFLHFGFLHFLFNLIALRDLGLPIEFRLRTPKFVGMVLIIAILSNTAQFVLAGGQTGTSTVPADPAAGIAAAGLFGGMSGVNYGLFGFAWVRGRLDPDSGIWLSPGTVVYMIGWFLFCLVMPGVANGAHAGGLMAGAAMGASTPMWKSLTGRR